VLDLALVVEPSVDPVEVGIVDEGSAVVALSRSVDSLAKLRHQVEQCVEFYAEF